MIQAVPYKWITTFFSFNSGWLPPPHTRPTAAHMCMVLNHCGRLPLLSTRPTVTFPAVGHHHPQASTKLYCLVTEAHRCEKLAQSFYAVSPAKTRTHDLLITSPTLYHSATTQHLINLYQCKIGFKKWHPTLSASNDFSIVWRNASDFMQRTNWTNWALYISDKHRHITESYELSRVHIWQT